MAHGFFSELRKRIDVQLACEMSRVGERALDVWAIFDNTVLGCALGNALAITDGIANSTVRIVGRRRSPSRTRKR